MTLPPLSQKTLGGAQVLKDLESHKVARELVQLFIWVGIANKIITDQGSCFMSTVMKETCRQLNVKQLKTSIFHPHTDGLVERFNKTLKQMLRKVIDVDRRNWDQLLPYVFFSIREVPQSSTGLSPFELLYGQRPRGMLPRLHGKLGAAAIMVSQHHRVCRRNARFKNK